MRLNPTPSGALARACGCRAAVLFWRRAAPVCRRRQPDLADSREPEIIRSRSEAKCPGFPAFRDRTGSSSTVSTATSPCTSMYGAIGSTPSFGG